MAWSRTRDKTITCTNCHKYPPRSLLPFGFTQQPWENDYLHQMSQIPSKISAALWLHTTTAGEWLPAPNVTNTLQDLCCLLVSHNNPGRMITCTKCHKYPPRSLLPYGFTQQPWENDYLHQMSQIPSKISAAFWLHTTTLGEWLPAPNVTNTLQDFCCLVASHNNHGRMITCTMSQIPSKISAALWLHTTTAGEWLPASNVTNTLQDFCCLVASHNNPGRMITSTMSQIPSKISAALWLHTTTPVEWLPAPNVTNTLQDLCCPMASHNYHGRMITCIKCHKYPPRSLLPYGFTQQPL